MTNEESRHIREQFHKRWAAKRYHYDDRMEPVACEALQDVAHEEAVEIIEDILKEMVN